MNVRRFLLLLMAAFLAWRVVAVGLSSHYAERLTAGDAAAVDKALAWSAHQPRAAVADAVGLLARDPVAAEAQLARLYRASPADPRPLLVAAQLAQARGEAERADALVEQALLLRPASASLLADAASHWAARGELDKAVSYWSRTLEADPSREKDVFPILLHVVEEPSAQAAIVPLALAPPPWWDRFFAEVARRTLDVETVRALYGLRRTAVAAPIRPAERRAYVARLQRDGLITEAYLVWVNGLSADERRHLGLLYDGGFELAPSQGGFGWHAPRSPRVEIRNAATYGLSGARALQLRFASRTSPFRHLYQPLFLDPGNYRVSGQVRPEGLDTLGGLRWEVSCLLPERKPLGESERFLGTSDWRGFSFDFVVPEDCRYQEIRLVSSGRRTFEHKINGEIWLDAMSLRRVQDLAATARAQASLRDGAAASQVLLEGAERPRADGADGEDSEGSREESGGAKVGNEAGKPEPHHR